MPSRHPSTVQIKNADVRFHEIYDATRRSLGLPVPKNGSASAATFKAAGCCCCHEEASQ